MMEYKEFIAKDESLAPATDFITDLLEDAGAGMKVVLQVSTAFEEIFINVAHYAYGEETGSAIVGVNVENGIAEIEIKDSGMPFNPLEKDDPDITLSVEDRGIGGLGIFMTKKLMDEVGYQRKDGFNIFTMKKAVS